MALVGSQGSTPKTAATDAELMGERPGFFKRELNRIKDVVTDKQAIFSLLYCIFFVALSVGIYYSTAVFAQQEYYRWVNRVIEQAQGLGRGEEHPNFLRLPDRFLDAFGTPSGWLNSQNAVTMIADLAPTFLLFSAPVVLFYFKYMDLLTQYTFTNVFIVLNNTAVEHLTVVPSAYGQDRCLEFTEETLGVPNLTRTSPDVLSNFHLMLFGTCTSMMWSGHTVNSILGLFYWLSALERRYPALDRKCLGIQLKLWIVFIFGLVEAALLLVNSAHYSMDIYIGYLLIFLILSNNKFKYICSKMNPFLPADQRMPKRLDYAELAKTIQNDFPQVWADIQAQKNGEDIEIKAADGHE